jgi:hypothetical protein
MRYAIFPCFEVCTIWACSSQQLSQLAKSDGRTCALKGDPLTENLQPYFVQSFTVPYLHPEYTNRKSATHLNS